MTLIKLKHSCEDDLRLPAIGGSAGNQQTACLPDILMGDLRHGDIEFLLQPGDHGFDPPTFLLEGMALGQVDRQVQNSDTHSLN